MMLKIYKYSYVPGLTRTFHTKEQDNVIFDILDKLTGKG